MAKRPPPLYDLKLSDEHMSHVFRLRGLGDFDRAEYDTQQGIIKWKANNHRLMVEAQEQKRAERKKKKAAATIDPAK